MGEPLAPLALTLDVSRKTARVIRQNITVFAIGLNTVAIGLAAAGLLPPMEAAVAHEIGSLAVLLNALRLLFVGRWGDLRPVRAWHRFTHALGHLRHDAQHVKQDLGHWASAHRRVLLRRGLPVCTAAAWLATGVRIVDVDEVMVVQRFGRAVATCDPGLHLRMPWPIETKRRMRPDAIRTATVGAPLRTDLPDNGIFAIEWETVHPGQPASAEGMMTGDIWQGDPADGSDQIASKLVQISAVVHYTVDDPTAYLLDVRSPDAVVLTTAESILRELVAGHRLDAVLADRRGEISDQCAQQLRTRLADYKTGVAVRSVVLLDVHPEPGKERMNVIEAYRDAARAQAEQKETVYGAHADAHRLLAEARGRRATELASAHSAGALRTAVAYGQAERFNAQRRAFRAYPELERWRVFLETVRTKLAGKRKLILDPTLEGRQQLFLAGGTSPLSLTPLLNRASSEPDPAFAGEEEHP
jgi:regulator of protease activity HflC (stomatin/prohibitin superfamily)